MMDWFCDVCDRSIKRNSIARHIMSKSHSNNDKSKKFVLRGGRIFNFVSMGIHNRDYIQTHCNDRSYTFKDKEYFFPLNETLSEL